VISLPPSAQSCDEADGSVEGEDGVLGLVWEVGDDEGGSHGDVLGD
jgi:hypothetical protein